MKKVNSKGYFFAALFLGLVGGVAQAGPIRGRSLTFFGLFLIMQNVFIDIEKRIDWNSKKKSISYI